MYKLPHWCVTDTRPSFYDVESATAIEQTAKLYKAMQDLIEEYNKWVDGTNKIINDFVSGTNKDYEAFKIAMAQQYQDFADIVELKLGAQDKEIKEAIDYMQNSIEPTIKKLIEDMNEAGELDDTILEAINNTKSYIDEKVTELNADIEILSTNLINANAQIEQLTSDFNDTNTEIEAMKTDIDSKQPLVNGGASTIVDDNLTASRVLVSNSSGKVGVSTITSTILGFLSNLKSNVQTQIDSKLGNAYNMLVVTTKQTTWKKACTGTSYVMYLVEVVSDELWLVNSQLHFWQTILPHETTNAVKIVDPSDPENSYVQLCNVNGDLMYITVGNVNIRIMGLK